MLVMACIGAGDGSNDAAGSTPGAVRACGTGPQNTAQPSVRVCRLEGVARSARFWTDGHRIVHRVDGSVVPPSIPIRTWAAAGGIPCIGPVVGPGATASWTGDSAFCRAAA